LVKGPALERYRRFDQLRTCTNGERYVNRILREAFGEQSRIRPLS
jgi:hypothetical protein